MRRAWIGIVVSLVAAVVMAADETAPSVVEASVRVEAGWLHADILFENLIDMRTASTIDSGLSGICAFEVSVIGPSSAALGRNTWTLRLEHDLWEDRYLITGPDGELEVANLAAMDSVCSRIEGVRVVPLDRLETDTVYQLTVAVEVLPLASVDENRLSRYIARRGDATREELDLDLSSVFGRLFKGGRAGRTTLAHTGPAFRPGALDRGGRP